MPAGRESVVVLLPSPCRGHHSMVALGIFFMLMLNGQFKMHGHDIGIPVPSHRIFIGYFARELLP